MVIPLWLPITFTQTIVTASHWVGLILPGIIEDPGSFAGISNSPIPDLGPEAKNLISLTIFRIDIDSIFKEFEKRAKNDN